MKCSQGVLSPQVSPGGRFALAVPVCWCLLLTLLSVIVGMPLITSRSCGWVFPKGQLESGGGALARGVERCREMRSMLAAASEVF